MIVIIAALGTVSFFLPVVKSYGVYEDGRTGQGLPGKTIAGLSTDLVRYEVEFNGIKLFHGLSRPPQRGRWGYATKLLKDELAALGMVTSPTTR